MNKLMKKKKKGFTLIELIAVIAILAILAAIAVPRVISYVDKSKRVAVQTEATTIYNAAEAAYNDGKIVAADKTAFDALKVSDVVTTLEGANLLSTSTNLDKFGNLKDTLTLKNLADIMNTNEAKLAVNSQGQLTTLPQATDQVSH
ncbi:type IV pilus assembly protein PilA [Clostridium moniliforme]|uniref:Type IV pilus assembly protein PilA n=1 Tax=Clostridium moniliforme TaxID=39489 RepID=A0ABS4EXN9_9CLOT|nr:type IV pilus assembly protein PilA [Clostridium moniliforme]